MWLSWQTAQPHLLRSHVAAMGTVVRSACILGCHARAGSRSGKPRQAPQQLETSSVYLRMLLAWSQLLKMILYSCLELSASRRSAGLAVKSRAISDTCLWSCLERSRSAQPDTVRGRVNYSEVYGKTSRCLDITDPVGTC